MSSLGGATVSLSESIWIVIVFFNHTQKGTNTLHLKNQISIFIWPLKVQDCIFWLVFNPCLHIHIHYPFD